MTTTPNDPIPLSQRRATTPEGWRAVLDNLITYRVGILRAFGALAALAAVIGFLIHLEALRRQARDTPLQYGVAEVQSKGIRTSARGVPDQSLYVFFQIKGHTVKALTTDEDKWARTLVGATVPVTYHKGQTGLYFIEDWQPIAPKTVVPTP